jgi:hypothetical protein
LNNNNINIIDIKLDDGKVIDGMFMMYIIGIDMNMYMNMLIYMLYNKCLCLMVIIIII